MNFWKKLSLNSKFLICVTGGLLVSSVFVLIAGISVASKNKEPNNSNQTKIELISETFSKNKFNIEFEYIDDFDYEQEIDKFWIFENRKSLFLESNALNNLTTIDIDENINFNVVEKTNNNASLKVEFKIKNETISFEITGFKYQKTIELNSNSFSKDELGISEKYLSDFDISIITAQWIDSKKSILFKSASLQFISSDKISDVKISKNNALVVSFDIDNQKFSITITGFEIPEKTIINSIANYIGALTASEFSTNQVEIKRYIFENKDLFFENLPSDFTIDNIVSIETKSIDDANGELRINIVINKHFDGVSLEPLNSNIEHNVLIMGFKIVSSIPNATWTNGIVKYNGTPVKPSKFNKDDILNYIKSNEDLFITNKAPNTKVVDVEIVNTDDENYILQLNISLQNYYDGESINVNTGILKQICYLTNVFPSDINMSSTTLFNDGRVEGMEDTYPSEIFPLPENNSDTTLQELHNKLKQAIIDAGLIINLNPNKANSISVDDIEIVSTYDKDEIGVLMIIIKIKNGFGMVNGQVKSEIQVAAALSGFGY